jgi:LuxR family maltose regulon positive regulatory protein
MGDSTVAEHWVDQMSIDVDAHSFYRFSGLIQPRLFLAKGERQKAADRLNDLLNKATESGWGFAVIAIMALQAIAAETLRGGVEILTKALSLSQPEGFVRTYVDAGPDLIPLLKEAAQQGIMPDYIGQILRAFGDKRKLESVSPLVEPLSERELEVLRLVTAGLSNKEIAEKLYLSPGTIKTHVHNICGKLGVRNRTEAATRAKEINIV